MKVGVEARAHNLALGRLRQEDHKSEASLGYTAGPISKK
jgi:hypothetical protein